MNKQAIALLSLGHFLIDFCQGVVPALVPFLVVERQFSYAMAASLVFAIGATSSIVQPLFGSLADRVGVWWLLPASILLAGVSLSLGMQARAIPWCSRRWRSAAWESRRFTPKPLARHTSPAATGHDRNELLLGRRRSGVCSGARRHDRRGCRLGHARDHRSPRPNGCSGALIGWPLSAAGLRAPRGWKRAELHRRGRLEGFRHPLRRHRLPLNRLLRIEYIPGTLLHGAVGPNRGGREPGFAIFLGTSIVGTLTGGYLADRLGRRKVIRMGFAGGVLFLALFAVTTNRSLAFALLVPLAIFLFMPTSVLVVLGQEYLPRRVGMASGVTLGLAVSVGGNVRPCSVGWPTGRVSRALSSCCSP